MLPERRADRGPAGGWARPATVFGWWSGLGPAGPVEVLGPGQRPAASGQAGADPGHVRVTGLVVSDRGDGPHDRGGRFRVALVLQFLRDRLHVALAQLAAEQGEERNVVDVWHAFGIARPHPVDDRGEERWQRHVVNPLNDPVVVSASPAGGRSGRPRRYPSRGRPG